MLTEADSHLGLTNRALASRARRVCLAFPLEGPRRRALPRHRPARAADRRPTAPAPARELGIGARRDRACSSSAARSAPARSTPPRSRRSPARPTASCTSPARRDFAELAGARRPLRPARLPDPVRRPRSPPPTSPWPAPAAACSSSPSTACRRSWSRTRTPPRTTRPPTRAGWSEAGAATVAPRRRAHPGSAARGGRRDRARPGAAARDGRGVARRWRGPTRRATSPARCCAARGGEGGARRSRAAPLDLVRGSTDRWPGLPLVTAEPGASFKAGRTGK